MNKEKLLLLLHLPPPIHGSSMVGKWINESELINNTFDCRYINILSSKSVKNTGKLSFQKICGMILLYIKLFYELVFHRPNKVYLALTSKGFAFYRDVFFVFLIKLFRVKIIYHLHNKGIKQNSKYRFNRLLYHFVFKNTKVILLSKNLYFDVEQYVKLDNINICPNGIPDINQEELLYLNKEISNLPKILFLSNLIESKGVYILLEALKILKDKNTNFEAIFVGGEGDITKEMFNQKILELDLSDYVKYLGKKYGKEKDIIFKKVNMFVFPTYEDCFPLVLIEAMQYEIPIVSCPEGGVPDIVENGNNGFLVPIKNPLALSDAIERLILNSSLRLKMGKKGRIKFLNEYTLSKFENNLTEILMKT